MENGKPIRILPVRNSLMQDITSHGNECESLECLLCGVKFRYQLAIPCHGIIKNYNHHLATYHKIDLSRPGISTIISKILGIFSPNDTKMQSAPQPKYKCKRRFNAPQVSNSSMSSGYLSDFESNRKSNTSTSKGAQLHQLDTKYGSFLRKVQNGAEKSTHLITKYLEFDGTCSSEIEGSSDEEIFHHINGIKDAISPESIQTFPDMPIITSTSDKLREKMLADAKSYWFRNALNLVPSSYESTESRESSRNTVYEKEYNFTSVDVNEEPHGGNDIFSIEDELKPNENRSFSKTENETNLHSITPKRSNIILRSASKCKKKSSSSAPEVVKMIRILKRPKCEDELVFDKNLVPSETMQKPMTSGEKTANLICQQERYDFGTFKNTNISKKK
jgi:hypothetical protein